MLRGGGGDGGGTALVHQCTSSSSVLLLFVVDWTRETCCRAHLIRVLHTTYTYTIYDMNIIRLQIYDYRHRRARAPSRHNVYYYCCCSVRAIPTTYYYTFIIYIYILHGLMAWCGGTIITQTCRTHTV